MAWLQHSSGVLMSEGVDSFAMEVLTDQKYTVRFWVLGTFVVLLSAASAFSYFCYMAQGMVAGDLLGLRGREADVAIAQQQAAFWLVASVCCWAASGFVGAVVAPIYEDASRLPRFIARFVVASLVAFVLTVLIGLVSFSIITASHRSVVH
jgi:hypothetical protein